MKSGAEHRIPLSDRAVELLEALPRESEFVFIGARKGRPLSDAAMLDLLKQMRPGATVHGFDRRSGHGPPSARPSRTTSARRHWRIRSPMRWSGPINGAICSRTSAR